LGYEAETLENRVQENDIIVMASDGVWDNLYAFDIGSCLKRYMSPKDKAGTNLQVIGDLQGAADCISQLAEKLGNKQGYLSPFAKEAMKLFYDF